MTGRYITIEREYGSGGTKIAKLLSEATGIPCYGREILEAVSQKYNFSIEEIEKYEETMTSSFLYSMYIMSKANTGDSQMLAKEGHIFVAEQEAIQQFAAMGSGIFVGHCASEALKDKTGVIRVFIRNTNADDKNRRITEEYEIPTVNAETTRKQFDRKRAHYYHANTGKRWDDLTKYDIVLDSGVLGIDGCVSVLIGLLT